MVTSVGRNEAAGSIAAATSSTLTTGVMNFSNQDTPLLAFNPNVKNETAGGAGYSIDNWLSKL